MALVWAQRNCAKINNNKKISYTLHEKGVAKQPCETKLPQDPDLFTIRFPMESDQLFTYLNLTDPTTTGDDNDHQYTRRRICTDGCSRPVNVCLCNTIPSEPLLTCTQIVILHHPHERRHKLATVPVLTKCLRNCHVVIGRRLRYGDSPILDSLHDAASENPNRQISAAFLFPGVFKILIILGGNNLKTRYVSLIYWFTMKLYT